MASDTPTRIDLDDISEPAGELPAPEPQEPEGELQERELPESELQEPELQEPELQEPELQEPELQEPEGELQELEPQEPEGEPPAPEDAGPGQQPGGGRHRRLDPPRRPWVARPRLLGALAVAVAVGAGGIALLVPAASARLNGERPREQAQGERATVAPTQTTPAPGATSAPQPHSLTAGPVKVDFTGYLSWALLDRTHAIVGSANLATTTTAGQMVRVWIVSDYLRQLDHRGTKPSAARLAQARRAIRAGDVDATQALYAAGGGIAQIRRMISICGLTDTTVDRSRWSRTRISARDAARLGGCVADGRAAGPSWTNWVRTEMTNVDGGSPASGLSRNGRWGIVDGLPEVIAATGVGIQNGWSVVRAPDEWHVNCLAVGDDWSLAVLTRFAAHRGPTYGAEACAKVASQLVAQPVTAT